MQAIEVRGVGDRHRIDWKDDLAVQDEFTIIWKGRILQQGAQYSDWGRFDFGYTYGIRFMGWGGTDRLQIHFTDGIRYKLCNYGNATFKEGWFCVIYNKGAIKFYYNKTCVLTTSVAHGTINWDAPYITLCWGKSWYRFSGRGYCKKVLYYNRQLSDNEIYNIQDGELVTNGLIFYFDFERDGFNAYDRSGNGHVFIEDGSWLTLKQLRNLTKTRQLDDVHNLSALRQLELR